MIKPKVRFNGFEKDYIKCPLEDCLSVSNERNNKMAYGKENAFSVSDDCGVVNQIQHLGRSYAGMDVSNYKILHTGQIVYTKSPLKAKPYGIMKVNNGETGIVSVLYAIYNVKESIVPDYINFYFDPYFRINKYLLPLINKGAKNTINISDEAVLKGLITVPTNKNEQLKIAAYFRSLETLIKQSMKKIKTLKQMKSASLLSLFPQAGETKPRVRFKGFEGEWKKVEFGSLLKECFDKSTKENEDILLSSAISGMYLNSELFGHQRGQSNIGYRKIRKNMLILSAQNLHLGNANVNLRFEQGLVSPAYKIYDLVNIYPAFMHQWIKCDEAKKKFLNATTAGASICRKNIVWNDLYKQNLFIPSSQAEQIKIASFFNCFDAQISLETQRLEKLKQIKMACLDKMFV